MSALPGSAQKRHQGTGRSKPAEVGNFSDQDHGGKGTDAFKGTEFFHTGRIDL